jgi:hypothetical protein
MTKYNAILLSDISDPVFLNKNVAPFTLANHLRNHGIDVTVIHHLNMWDFDELVQVIKFLVNKNTLFVGFSNFFYRVMETHSVTGETKFVQSNPNILLPHGLENGNVLSKIIKQINKDCKIVIGGPAATDNISNKNIDYVFKGYADKTILDFVDFLIENKKESTILNPTYWYKNLHGINIVNGTTYQDNNFVSTALNWLPKDAVLPGETLPIEIARGCIFQCKFCSYPLNGKQNLEHIKDIAILKEEFLYNYEKFGVTRYFFLDDTFNDSIEKLEMIEEVSNKLPFRLEYWAYIRLDLVAAKPHSLKIMHNSGLRAAHLGLETLNKKTGSIIGKGADPKKLIETIASVKKQYGNDLLLHSSFIIGLPEENEQSVTQTVQKILNKEILVDSADFHSLVIQPKGFTNYLSAFGINFNQYGYIQKAMNDITDLEKLHTKDAIAWQNEYMDLHRAIELATDFNKKMWASNNMRASMAFQISNLGFKLQDFTNTKLVDIDWHLLKTTKCKRFDDYKKMFLKNIGYV